ncbi:uncharacterized protein [Watersipora subatra]|uniref:uncharacterized protein isoform X2 n=1 Tax=Watersipora subatra TaxID=2589382 RepID=UPI00355B011B
MRGPNVSLADYPDTTVFRVIEEVQKHKILYDIPRKDRSAYAVLQRRNEKWNEMSILFGLPAGECFGIWNKLRSTFTRHFKYYRNCRNANKQVGPCDWKYFEHLLFLIPYIEFAGQQSSSVGTQPNQTIQQNQFAKKAVKRSKTILMKNFENGDSNVMDLTKYQPGGASIKINVIHLVELVKQHPVIYSKTTANNSAQKMAAWKEISKEIGAPARACLTRWMYLWRKLQITARTQNKEKWVWHSVMEHFIPFLTTRPRARHRRLSPQNEMNQFDTSPHTQDWEEAESCTSENLVVTDSFSADADQCPMPMKMEHPVVDGELHIISATQSSQSDIKDEVSSLTSCWRPETKDCRRFSEYNFGICMAEMLEDIPKENRARLKAKVINVLAGAI